MSMKKNKKKIIGIISVGRTDYSYFKPILQEIIKDPSLNYFLIIAGMHLSTEFGSSYREILNDGFRIDEKIKATILSNDSKGTAETTGIMVARTAAILNKQNLDALLVLGDRYETLGAVTAALFYNIPIFHISGGDVTAGIFDEQIRHAITKMAHIHLVSNRLSASRVLQMGEERWRVFNTGSTSIDVMKKTQFYSEKDFYKIYNLDFSKKLFLVTFHPETLQFENTGRHMNNLIRALKHFNDNILITYPNADPGSKVIIMYFKKLVQEKHNVKFVKNMGIKGYYSAMRYANVMVGNSSSGIVEAATYKLPVVNIGDRQKDRLRAKNVIDAACDYEDIVKKIYFSLSDLAKIKMEKIKNPYGYGNASQKIVKALKRILDKKTTKEIITKRFILYNTPNFQR